MSPQRQLQAREAHRGLSFALALVVHLLFGAFLLISVQWQTRKQEPVVVELWGPPPAAPVNEQPAAKPVPERPEPPRPPQPEVAKPDIATERITPRPTLTPTPQPKATPTPRPAPTAAAKPTPQPTQPPKPKPTKKPSEMDQLLGTDALIKPDAKPQAGGKPGGQGSNPEAPAGSTGRGSSASGLESYAGRVRDLIRSRLVYDDTGAGNPSAVYKISLLPSGEILSATLVRSSGDTAYNEATYRAIMALGQFPPLPSNKPFTGSEREWTITFRLRE